MTESSHTDVDYPKFILDKSILQDKSLTPARLFVSVVGSNRWNIYTPQWESATGGLKVTLTESSSRTLIGDHVCTCDPS